MFVILLKKKKNVLYIKYFKNNKISLLEKKKITNIFINLHFLVVNYKFEYYDDYFYKYNFYYFSVKKFFIKKKVKQLYNSKYFKYVKESNYFQYIFSFKEEILTISFSYDSIINLNFFNFFFNFFIFNLFFTDLIIFFDKKTLKLFKNLIKKDIKNINKLIKKLKIKKLKKKNLISNINEKIFLIKKSELFQIYLYDEKFFELYIFIKIELKNIEKNNLIKKIKKNINNDNIFKYYKNVDDLLNLIQKKTIINLYNKNYWKDLNNNEKLNLINIEPKYFLEIIKKDKTIKSFYLKICKEIDVFNLLENEEKKIFIYKNFFENNKIETFIKMTEKHLDSEIFAKKEIDYILYNCFNLIKSTMVFKVEKKKKIFLEPTIDTIIKNEIKKNIITSNKVIIEYNLDVIVWNHNFINNFKNLSIDNYISIKNNINYFFILNNEILDDISLNLKNDILNNFNLFIKKNISKKEIFFFQLDYLFNIRKENFLFNNYFFNKKIKYINIKINFF